ncbi:ferredoxin--NADP reductase [Haloferacaceae archaeon DSL9]
MTLSATIAAVHDLTPDVRQFRLAVPEHTFDYKPGQHTTVRMPTDGGSEDAEVRPYTPTSLPGTDQLTIAIKRYPDGTVSRYMHEREYGDVIEIGSLEGNLHLRDPAEDVAFVSTGTGITPMMAMLKDYVHRGTGTAHFFFGEKTRSDLIYRETLEQFAAQYDPVEVHFCLSEESWDGPTGHVQEQLPSTLDSLADGHVYVCGVPEMVVETKELLADEGVPDDQIFSEGWEEDDVAEE